MAGGAETGPSPPLPTSGAQCVGSTTQPCQDARMEILVGGPYPDHPFGHAALRVVTPYSDTTYDFGRYARTWGVRESEGDGMLRIWSSFDRYIAGERATGRRTDGYVYIITVAQADAVNNFFNAKVAGLTPTADRGHMKQYKLAQDYHALRINCVTMTIDGAKVARPNVDAGSEPFNVGNGLDTMQRVAARAVGWPNRLFMPRDLGNFLDSRVATGEPTKVSY